jgi:hypothetical protein
LFAQVFVVRDGARLWLQEELVAKGLARVYSLADNTACVHELLASEAEARDRRLGVWGSWAYRIQSADDLKRLDRLMHTYQLVEGKVVAVGQVAGRIYLNFAGGGISPSVSSARMRMPSPLPASTSRVWPARRYARAVGFSGGTVP